VSKNTKLVKLKKLKSDYKNERKGYRYRQYEILANTMAIVIELRSDESAAKGFLKLSGKKIAPTKAKKTDKWLTAAAVAYVTGAKSESAVKLAWKRARVLDYLHDFHGIPPEDIAAEIRKRGGIEAVARLAAEEDPLRPKSKSDAEKIDGTKAGFGKGPRAHIKSASADEHVSGANLDDDLDDNADSSTLEEGTMLVRISGDLRAKLEEVGEGKPAKLIGTRAGDWGEPFLFEVERVVPVVKRRKLRWGKPAKAKRKQ
jgi:hypothetical protein